jgi:hypothetical protein
MQQELEQWKEQVSHLWNVANDYLRQVPLKQLHAACTIALITTLLLYIRQFLQTFFFFFNFYSIARF